MQLPFILTCPCLFCLFLNNSSPVLLKNRHKSIASIARIYISLGKKKSIIFSVDGYTDRFLVKYRSNNFIFMLVGKVTFRSKKNSFAVFCLLHSVVSYSVLKMEVNKEKIRYILQFFFDKGENASQTAKIVNGVYGSDTVTANYAQIWFRRFRSGIFDVKDAPRTGRPVVENVDKIGEMIEVDQHVSSRNIAQELKIDHKTVLNHLHKAGFKKKLDVWVPHQLTEKNMMDRISICEALAKRNEIDPFLKRMVTGDEKCITYDNPKRSWSNSGEAPQTVVKPGLTARKVLLCIWWDWKGIIYYELLPYGQTLNSDLYYQQLDRLKIAIDQKRP
ncbi:histone-lysine N-methyltransferase SETMAR-like isoform 1-T2 [Glossina fuscipes fuscipes]